MQIMAISGSLRAASSHGHILQACATLLPDEITCVFYHELAEIPSFSPDITEPAASVTALRSMVSHADAVIICTPEYAFGVPGALKNALDWLVSSGELNGKPVAAISASPLYAGGDKALASLQLTLTALGTKMTDATCCSIGDIYNRMNKSTGVVNDALMLQQLQSVTDALIVLLQKSRDEAEALSRL